MSFYMIGDIEILLVFPTLSKCLFTSEVARFYSIAPSRNFSFLPFCTCLNTVTKRRFDLARAFHLAFENVFPESLLSIPLIQLEVVLSTNGGGFCLLLKVRVARLFQFYRCFPRPLVRCLPEDKHIGLHNFMLWLGSLLQTNTKLICRHLSADTRLPRLLGL